VLSFFGDSEDSRKNYLQYLKKGINQGRKPELVGGGLIRRMGGWWAVLAIRKRDKRQVTEILSSKSHRVLMILLKRT
jgi:REP-associated tyrosine transposase